jgi:hypothetical protein
MAYPPRRPLPFVGIESDFCSRCVHSCTYSVTEPPQALASQRRGAECQQSNNAETTLQNTNSWERIDKFRAADPLCFWAFRVVGQLWRTNLSTWLQSSKRKESKAASVGGSFISVGWQRNGPSRGAGAALRYLIRGCSVPIWQGNGTPRQFAGRKAVSIVRW